MRSIKEQIGSRFSGEISDFFRGKTVCERLHIQGVADEKPLKMHLAPSDRPGLAGKRRRKIGIDARDQKMAAHQSADPFIDGFLERDQFDRIQPLPRKWKQWQTDMRVDRGVSVAW